MSVAIIYSRAQFGMEALLVSVEVHISNGLPSFSIVGLPEAAVRESKDRVRAALINSHYDFPKQKIIVNLAPAELPKQGGRFDLPIALGLLVASKQLAENALKGYEFIGELSLTGELNTTTGVFPAAHACSKAGNTLITAFSNQHELTSLNNNAYLCAPHLLNVCAHLNKVEKILPCDKPDLKQSRIYSKSFNDIHGQQRAKRAMKIAAAGGHHLLMVGSPGSGKTMLANRFTSLLTNMNQDEMLESKCIYSIANVTAKPKYCRQRPFRAPHHTVSTVGLVGGGSTPRPGEISLAHNGVLFLDEFTEFNRQALEALREPIETGAITISRANAQIAFPARFQLIAAMNPCPNGCDINDYGQCQCSNQQLNRYRNKISAPILDRIDIQISVPKVASKDLLNDTNKQHDNWENTKQKVRTAFEIQMQRQNCINALLEVRQLKEVCRLTKALETKTIVMLDQLRISARGLHKILKVARTIADLEQAHDITQQHITEAMSYRQFDRLLKN